MTERTDSGHTGADAPLRGIRVIDYSHFLAGPYLSRCLASMGAEVIKVERPTAGDAGRAHPYFIDGHSGYFLQQNMGKQGLCVNVRDPRGLELMHRLVDGADVFVENYRPSALDRLGLGYADLAKRNPRLVYCSISAYGHTGVYGVFPGRDGYLVITAQTDALWLRLAKLIGGDALAADSRFHGPEGRNTHREAIFVAIPVVDDGAAVGAGLPRRAGGGGSAVRQVQRIDEVLADPQIQARGMLIEQDHPSLGRIRLPNLPFRFSGYELLVPAIAPSIGQHNRDIAASLGYSEEEIASMTAGGVLYQEDGTANGTA